MQIILNAGVLDYTSRFGEEGGYQTIGEAIAVLSIIWGVLEAFHYFACTLPDKRQKKMVQPQEQLTASTATEPEPVVDTNEEEIVAVIAAAIAAAQAESPSGQFRVVSFRKK